MLVPNRQDAYSALNAPVHSPWVENIEVKLSSQISGFPPESFRIEAVSRTTRQIKNAEPGTRNAERRTPNAKRPRPPSMLEMTRPGENHRHLALIRRSNYRVVPNRTARLNDRGRPSFRRRN